MRERLFVAQFVVAVENQWFAPGMHGPPTRVERRHHIEAQLFTATDTEAAYQLTCEWLPRFSDDNLDGPGDLTRIFAVGIHQIEELQPAPDELGTAVRELYGVDVGGYDPAAVDATGVSLLRDKAELSIFQLLQR